MDRPINSPDAHPHPRRATPDVVARSCGSTWAFTHLRLGFRWDSLRRPFVRSLRRSGGELWAGEKIAGHRPRQGTGVAAEKT